MKSELASDCFRGSEMSVSLTVVLCQFELPSLLTSLVIVTCRIPMGILRTSALRHVLVIRIIKI